MSLSELLPIVDELTHREKLGLLQFLANSLARDEGVPRIESGTRLPIWSPFNAFSAAETMNAVLQSTDETL